MPIKRATDDSDPYIFTVTGTEVTRQDESYGRCTVALRSDILFRSRERNGCFSWSSSLSLSTGYFESFVTQTQPFHTSDTVQKFGSSSNFELFRSPDIISLIRRTSITPTKVFDTIP